MQQWQDRRIDADHALDLVTPGARIFLTGMCAAPQQFEAMLCQNYPRLHNVEVVQMLNLGKSLCITPAMKDHVRLNSMFLDSNTRQFVRQGLAEFTPVFLSEVPALFRNGDLPLDLAVIQVSPPDEHGFCSYGIEVGVTKSAAESAKIVLAEINENMPRTLGNSFIHMRDIDYFIEVDYPLPNIQAPDSTDIQDQIARHIAAEIPDGATLQTGIGGIPDAVLRYLKNHKDLGVHTEMFSDGVMNMIEAGVITNRRKSIHPGKVTAGFIIGSHQLFEYVHDNPIFEMHPTEYVNDPFIIAQNHTMISINSALEVDLTGQVCADSLGHAFYSGVGGQVDFVRGASRSRGGKSIIALPSTTPDGKISRIVPALKTGAGVTTSRNDVRYIATEYGVARLHGRSISQRVGALIEIAHPDFREELSAFARHHYHLGRIYGLN